MPSRKGKKKSSNKGGRKKASSQAPPRSSPAPSNKMPVAAPPLEIVRVVNADGSVTIQSEPFVPPPAQAACPFQDYDNQAIEIESEPFEPPAPEPQLFVLDPDATYIESEAYTPPKPVPTPIPNTEDNQFEPAADDANEAIYIQSEDYSPPIPPPQPAGNEDELDDAIFIESEPCPAFKKIFQHADATPMEAERETTETAEKEEPAVTELSSVVTHFLLPAAAVVVGALVMYKFTSRKRN